VRVRITPTFCKTRTRAEARDYISDRSRQIHSNSLQYRLSIVQKDVTNRRSAITNCSTGFNETRAVIDRAYNTRKSYDKKYVAADRWSFHHRGGTRRNWLCAGNDESELVRVCTAEGLFDPGILDRSADVRCCCANRCRRCRVRREKYQRRFL